MAVGQTQIVDTASLYEKLIRVLTGDGSLWRMASVDKPTSRFLMREQAKLELYHTSRKDFDRRGVIDRLHAKRLNLSVSEKTSNKGHLLPDIIVPIANRSVILPNPNDENKQADVI